MARTPPENGTKRNGAAADTDRELLTQFVRQADEAAFTEIVRRHADLVFGVCLRTLRDRQAAEDAFQATFLVLARSARKIRRRTSLGSWLHGVACRVSLRALAKRHRRRETCSPMNTITTEPTLQDVGALYEQQLLDVELRELPEKYREPLVLHYLQGLTNQQVADRLDVSVSCVEGRLKRGRKELRLRLTRRGLELGAALTAVHLATTTAKAGALESLITSTGHIAASQSLTSPGAAAAPSEAVTQLAAKELAMLATTKTSILLTSAAAAVLTVGVIAGINSSTGTAHADGPSGGLARTPSIVVEDDSTISADFDTVEIAQSDPVLDVNTTDARDLDELRREIQALNDQIRALQAQLEDRVAQQQVERADAQATAEEMEDIRARQGNQIADLRQQMGDMMAAGMGAMTPQTDPQVQTFDFSESDPQTQRIKAALDSETNIEFPGNPLQDVLDFISASHNIPILLDEPNALDVGISPDEEVSLFLTGISLRNALEIMLSNVSGVQLDYVVENQVLKITSREHADSIMDTRVYSLNQLPADYAPEDIARVIIRTIAPESWRNSVVPSDMVAYGGMMGGGYDDFDLEMEMEEVQPVGGRGAGSIEPLPGVLVVTQSQRVHRQIVDLLSQLKRQHEVVGAQGGGIGDFGMMEMMDGEYGASYGGAFGYGAGASAGGGSDSFEDASDAGGSDAGFGDDFNADEFEGGSTGGRPTRR